MQRKRRVKVDLRNVVVVSDKAINWDAVPGGKPAARARHLKYGNKPTVVDNVTFPSKREARRYQVLKRGVQDGVIKNLLVGAMGRGRCAYPLKVNDQLICTYVADFVYHRCGENVEVVEDCKGFRNRLYKLKKKLMKALYGIDIYET